MRNRRPTGWAAISSRRPSRAAILEERDLHAADSGRGAIGAQRIGRGMPVAAAVRPEECDAVPISTLVVAILPVAAAVEPHHRIEPAPPVKVGPLVGKAQVGFDDAPADGLD